MDIKELCIGDTIRLEDSNGYMKYVFEHGGEYRPDRIGTVFGFTRDIAHACMIKVILTDQFGDMFGLYEGDLKYWERI